MPRVSLAEASRRRARSDGYAEAWGAFWLPRLGVLAKPPRLAQILICPTASTSLVLESIAFRIECFAQLLRVCD